ncbi:MAG: MerR family DNA-binding transcriptional regulator [Caldilineaceae bacterium]|nr:MerR family DNA-binding transcriptional regulator [Caldilineaceae bacterium]HRJ45494.1 MerR family DNA-binding transcriptional regulator [Caldilineaceae bacterium]
MDTNGTVYLTLKRAAQRLGVHEQTLRSWERRGLIRMARLPQSGYRRVPEEEVLRLQTAMATPKRRERVRIEAPAQDAASLTEANRLAALVRAELVRWESDTSFDELMQTRRGRQWLS